MKITLDYDGTVTSPVGFKAGATACGLKASGDLDLGLLTSERPCTAAGVFTQNQVVAAPVILDRDTLAANRSDIWGVVANAGIANACTGEPGMAAAREMQAVAAAALGLRPETFFVLSTGVIGVPLPMNKIRRGIEIVARETTAEGGRKFAQAIMTTDTRAKHLAARMALPSGVVTIGGVAKGSGMIHPNMATMLGLITTDASLPGDLLQELLKTAVEGSFNCISVDGDTSTNDTVLLLANGAGGVTIDDREKLAQFTEGLNTVCLKLAKMIIQDGEGATKFVEVRVTGGRSQGEAKAVAATIVTSPLVKTALAGSDPNWGRILAAAGRTGVSFDQDRVELWIQNLDGPALQLVDQGTPTAYTEANAAAIFARPEIVIRLNLGQGEAEAVMWTSDLTREYVTINADYRT